MIMVHIFVHNKFELEEALLAAGYTGVNNSGVRFKVFMPGRVVATWTIPNKIIAHKDYGLSKEDIERKLRVRGGRDGYGKMSRDMHTHWYDEEATIVVREVGDYLVGSVWDLVLRYLPAVQ